MSESELEREVHRRGQEFASRNASDKGGLLDGGQLDRLAPDRPPVAVYTATHGDDPCRRVQAGASTEGRESPDSSELGSAKGNSDASTSGPGGSGVRGAGDSTSGRWPASVSGRGHGLFRERQWPSDELQPRGRERRPTGVAVRRAGRPLVRHREVSRVVLRCIGRRATPRSRRWKLRRAAPPRRSRRSQPALSRGGPIHAARSNGIRTPNQAEGADRSPGRRLHGPLEAVQRRQGVVDGRLQVGHRLREGPAGPRKEEKRERGNGPEKCRFSRNPNGRGLRRAPRSD